MNEADFETAKNHLLADIAELGSTELAERTKSLLEALAADKRPPSGDCSHELASQFSTVSMVNTNDDVRRLTTVSGLAVGVMGLVAVVALLTRP